MSKGTRKTILGLLVSLAVIGSGYCFLWIPTMRRAHYFGVVTGCSSNLRRIAQAIQQYEAAYHDWPLRYDDWERRLIAAGLIDENCTRCPVRTDKAFHYCLVSPSTTQPADGSQGILMIDDPDAHWGYSVNVLFTDSHVQSFRPNERPPELESALKKLRKQE